MSRKEIIFLVVEAGETGLSTRKMVLETAGFNVISAISAAQGLQFLSDLPVNAIVFDPGVHDMPPHDFMKTAKQRRPDIPIYVLSNHAWIDDELKPYTEGVIQRMTDPRHMVELLAKRFPENGQRS